MPSPLHGCALYSPPTMALPNGRYVSGAAELVPPMRVAQARAAHLRHRPAQRMRAAHTGCVRCSNIGSRRAARLAHVGRADLVLCAFKRCVPSQAPVMVMGQIDHTREAMRL